MVQNLLNNNGFGTNLAKTISRIVTLNNSLPQGAPTSPAISNSYLSKFDEFACDISRERGLDYTRYADDITISGNNKQKINRLIKELEKNLKSYGLKLNHKKTLIASKGGQQRVTGIVVNEKPVPSRKYRRKVRSIFHHAKKEPLKYKSKTKELNGYYSYIKSFPDLKNNKEVSEYLSILQNLKKL